MPALEVEAAAEKAGVESDEITALQAEIEQLDGQIQAAGLVGANNPKQGRGLGPFGPIFDGYRHDAQGAIAKLMREKAGEATAALHHPEVGDIDLVWGREPGPDADGYGLAKIAAKHPEVLADLQGFLSRLKKDAARSGKNRLRLSDASGQAVVRLEWDGQQKTWLLTAFDSRAGSGARTDTAAARLPDDTASLETGTARSIAQEADARNAVLTPEIIAADDAIARAEAEAKAYDLAAACALKEG